jgi:hypothetical protein
LAVLLAAGANGGRAWAAEVVDPCACLPLPVLPVALAAMPRDGGWQVTLRTPPCPRVVEIRVGVDGEKPESLGRVPDVERPGELLAVHDLFVPVLYSDGDRERKLAVELVRPGGEVDGPYPLLLSPREERLAAAKRELERAPRSWVTFAEHGSTFTWLGFHNLFAMRGSLREVRYSVDDCSLRHRLRFTASGEPRADRVGQPDDLSDERPFLTLPKASTHSVCVQAVFVDGSESQVLELVRSATDRRAE